MGTKIKGIDVSYYQGTIDFQKLKNAGIKFVIIKAGYGKYGKQKDECFEENYKNAKAAGLDVGAYWFSYAKTANEALQEAKVCLAAIKGKKFEYPIYFDVEGDSLVSKSVVSAMCKTFCNALEDAGYFAGIYISRSPAQTILDDTCKTRYALWLAEYSSKCNYSGSYGMWQYSDKGSVSGINGNVDMDYCYVDYPSKIKSAGLNGYTATTTNTTTKILDSSGFKLGNKTSGVLALKQLIILANCLGIIKQGVDNNNVFGDGTQKAVNLLLNQWGYTQNGIAGNNFIKKLQTEIAKQIK